LCQYQSPRSGNIAVARITTTERLIYRGEAAEKMKACFKIFEEKPNPAKNL
jgi:hypothetical protein